MKKLGRQLHRVLMMQRGSATADGQLLTRFVEARDEAAFDALVHSHGPMVYGVCRRVLRHHHEAEDAFQATFLVLARSAASVAPRTKVADWLYGVAYRTALKASAAIAKRRIKEQEMTTVNEPKAPEQDLWPELEPILDRELSRLPEKYRVAVILCDLEGKPHREVAEQLGCAEGTLSSRLTRARRMLAKRLVRQGLTLTAGSVALLLTQNAASASAPSALMAATVQAASAFAASTTACGPLVSTQAGVLAKGMLKSLLLAKIQLATAVVIAVAAAGFWVGQARVQERIDPQAIAELRAAIAKNAETLAKIKTIYVKDQTSVALSGGTQWQKRYTRESWRSGARVRSIFSAHIRETPSGGRVVPDPAGEVTIFGSTENESRSWSEGGGSIWPRLSNSQTTGPWDDLFLEIFTRNSLSEFSKEFEIVPLETKTPGILRCQVRAGRPHWTNGLIIELETAHGSMIRKVEGRRGDVIGEVEEFAEFADGIWVPKRVRRRIPTSYKHLSPALVEVLDCRINEEFTDDEVSLNFPEGSTVDNWKSNEQYVWGKGAPATIRTFKNREEFELFLRHGTLEVTKPSGSAPVLDLGQLDPTQSRTRVWRLRMIVGNVVLIVAIAVVILIRRRSSRS